MSHEEFKNWRHALGNELLEAHANFRIWEQLWPNKEDTVRIQNQYRVFFQVTRKAHLDQFLLHIAKLTEHKGDSINLWRLLDMAEQYPDIFPHISASKVKQLRQRLEASKDIRRNIRKHRDKRIAHLDEDIQLVNSPVLYGEAKKLLEEVEDIFTTLLGETWVFDIGRMNDTAQLIETLAQK